MDVIPFVALRYYFEVDVCYSGGILPALADPAVVRDRGLHHHLRCIVGEVAVPYAVLHSDLGELHVEQDAAVGIVDHLPQFVVCAGVDMLRLSHRELLGQHHRRIGGGLVVALHASQELLNVSDVRMGESSSESPFTLKIFLIGQHALAHQLAVASLRALVSFPEDHICSMPSHPSRIGQRYVIETVVSLYLPGYIGSENIDISLTVAHLLLVERSMRCSDQIVIEITAELHQSVIEILADLLQPHPA